MAKSRGRGSPSTTQAVRVGVTRTGKFGNRVSGVAGREASGGRTGQTDAAVSAGSKAYGRSAPGTGVGGAGGSGGTTFVENTNNPGDNTVGGGDTSWTDIVDPVPEPSVTPITKTNPIADPITKSPITTPRSYTPVPVYNPTPTPVKRTVAPVASKPTAPVSKPFVTPIGGQLPYTSPTKTPTVNTYTGFTTSGPAAGPNAAKPAPTVNKYTGFTTSGPAAGPNAAKPVPKTTSGPAAGPAAANPVAKPAATTKYTGIPTTPAKPTTTAPKVTAKPAPAPKPAPKPAPTKAATTTRRVAQ